MSFIAYEFIIFVLAVLAFYYVLPCKLQKYVLLLGSLYFYFCYSIFAFIFLLITASTVYCAAIFIYNYKGKLRNVCMYSTILFNVSLLIVLKYTKFLTYVSKMEMFQKTYELKSFSLKVLIPLGISFYTLSLLGYLIDVYREKYKPETNIATFILFATFFPHILQGPIARYDQLGHQLKEKHVFDYNKVAFGAQLMIWGYIKKMVIADRAAIFVDSVYADYSLIPGVTLLIASLLYTIQIYADFSGCVDITRGIAEMLDISLVNNFSQPYFASSINDFWRRWHISLSSWFRDYVYIPLGGNRKGIVRRWINVLVVFVISGFWHGVGFNFVFWGLVHGLYQVFGYVLKPLKCKFYSVCKINTETKIFKKLQVIVTFMLINLAWIFFRIANMRQAFDVVKRIITDLSPWVLTDGSLLTYGLTNNAWTILCVFIVILYVVDKKHEDSISVRRKISEMALPFRWAIYIGTIIIVMMFGIYGLGYDASSFIYMNF